MSAFTPLKPGPVRKSVPETLEAPPAFAPSAELGNQLQHLEQTQVEIDRCQAEELARLRAIQDRD
jgi:hypothetical protein